MLAAIETSCDETSVAIFDIEKASLGNSFEKSLLSNIVSSQVLKHREYGGVVPELAAREHLVNLPTVFDEALKEAEIRSSDIKAVAVTSGPGLNVALVVGVSFAKALAWGLDAKLYEANHLEGHLFAHELEDNSFKADYPRLTLLVSGGHTVLVLVRSFRNYEILAETIDDAAGEAFDKSATLINLPYPGGPSLSKLADEGEAVFKFPIGVEKEANKFSFSGLKTAVHRQVKKEDLESETAVKNLAASTQDAIVRALILKTKQAAKEHNIKSLIVTGGVAANKKLREEAKNLAESLDIEYVSPSPKYCTDNAAMIGVCGIYQHLNNYPEAELSFSPKPRWPISELKCFE